MGPNLGNLHTEYGEGKHFIGHPTLSLIGDSVVTVQHQLKGQTYQIDTKQKTSNRQNGSGYLYLPTQKKRYDSTNLQFKYEHLVQSQ